MNNTFLVITSIAGHDNMILKQYADEANKNGVSFIVIGDTKSPDIFILEGCDFYSVERQLSLDFRLAKVLPFKHYARKNLGYLIAFSKGAEVIIETDDDNLPLNNFWISRKKHVNASLLINEGWVNVYRYFTKAPVWPRGYSLENLKDKVSELKEKVTVDCPIQQGLADGNPDIDAICRLIVPLPISFNKKQNIALGINSVCPFNSQNTTWFKEAFPLLYLPSYCSFRMTDIWRSFIAQRIAWTCNWPILFHKSTVYQIRNEHNLLVDFTDEISGYLNNGAICSRLSSLKLADGEENITNNMFRCYEALIEMGLIDSEELILLGAWVNDIASIKQKSLK